MAKPVALLTLRNAAITVADMQNSAAPFAQPLAVNAFINQAITQLHDEITVSAQDYFVRQQTITTNTASDPAATSDVAAYKLPPDFYETRGCDANLGGQQFVTMHRSSWNDRNVYKLWGTTGWFVGQPLLYYLRDNFLIFQPTPQSAFAVTHWYYPIAPTLADDADTVDVLNGGDEFLIWKVASKMLFCEESFDAADRADAKAAEQLERIRRLLPNRDAAEPPMCTEIVRRSNGFRGSSV